MSKCWKCEGRGRLYVKVKKEVGGVVREYDAMAPCDQCAGHGVFPLPPLAPPKIEKPPRGGEISGRNWEMEATAWIDKNPAIIEVYLRMARSKAARGRKFGIGALTEVVRWECDDPAVYGSDFKINNNFRAYIARHLVAVDPGLERYIEFRETRF